MKSFPRMQLFAMVPVLLIGFALAAAQLNVDILWVDEMASVSAMGAEDPPYSVFRIVESIVEHNPDHVPLYYIIGAGWARVVGWSQVSLRYLSLLFGVLTIAWLYRLSADVLDRRTAYLAAFLFATSAFVIIYFHELRNYTLWTLLSVIHVWHYWRLVEGAKTGRASWIIFVMTTSALLYTHPFSPFVLLSLAFHHLLFVAKDRRWLNVTMAWAAGLFTFLPYVPLLAIGFSEAASTDVISSKALASRELIPMLANVFANGVDLLWLAVIAAGGWTLLRKRSPSVLRLLVVCAGMVLSLFIFHEIFPFLSTTRLRYFLVALAFALVLFAHFLVSIPSRRLMVPLFALVWLGGGYSIYQQAEHWEYAGHHSLIPAHPRLHRFADAILPLARPHDAVLGFTQATWMNSGLRYGFSTVEYYSRAVLGIHGAFIWTGLGGSDLREEFYRRVDNHPYLLFTYEPGNIPASFEELRTLLEHDYAPCEVLVDTDGVFVQRYTYHTLECDREYQPIHYDNGIKNVDKFADYIRAENSVRVVTGWEVADDAQLQHYNVSVQIITPDWQSVRQAPDRHLYDDILKWYVVELSTENLPPGDYRAMVILYDRETVKKVPGIDMATGVSGDIFAVLTFTIDA